MPMAVKIWGQMKTRALVKEVEVEVEVVVAVEEEAVGREAGRGGWCGGLRSQSQRGRCALQLLISGREIAPASLRTPLVLLGSYL